MASLERLTAFAEAIADGDLFDWASAERSAGTPDERAAIATYRDLAVVGGLFAAGTANLRVARRVPAPLEPGAVWGSLRIDAHVGRGRFGNVYRAWDPALHRVVALKLVAAGDEDGSVDSEVIEEGRLMASVRHPNVVAIHGAQRIGDVVGLSMEFIEGRTLEGELLERGPFSAAELMNVAKALCGALTAVHAAGLIHRDVKATNVIRETGGRLVLGDFGTGLAADAMPDRRVGMVGTPVYIAPEIFQRGAATQKSDLYSLGVLLFHLATGRFPVSGRSMLELRAAHERDSRPAIATLRPDLPARLRVAIEGLLDPDPERRFATAEGVWQAIAAPVETKRRSRMMAAAIAVATVAAAAWVWNVVARDAVGGGAPRGDRGLIAFAVVRLHPPLQSTMAFRGTAFDRQLIACQDQSSGDVAVCDFVRGEVRTLRAARPDSRNPFGRNSLLLSPDGTRVAYRLDEGPPGRRLHASLHVSATDDGHSVELFRSAGSSAPYMHRWIADGSALLVSEPDGNGRRIFLLPVNGTARTDLYRAAPELGQFFDLSPDGRFLTAARDVGRGDRDLVVIELATGVETPLIAGISSVGWPLWTLDGGAVVFTSVRGSSSVVMSVPLANGAATDRPKVEWRAGRSEIRLMGFGADGSLFAMERPGPRTAYVAPIDLSRSFAGPAQLVDPADAENTIGADWSPDGSRVAYLRGLLGHPGGPPGTLVIRTAGGGVVTEIPLSGWLPESATQVRWSPDGRRLAVAYGGATPRAMAIDVVDLDTRRGQPVVSGEPFAYPRWEPSGEWLYYQQDAAIIRHHLSSGTSSQAYAAEGLGIQRNGGFDASREDGALAILVTRPKIPGCMIRVVEPAGSTVDRHTFVDHCRAIAWSRDGTSLLVSTMSDAALPSLWSLHRHSGAPIRLPIEADVFHDLSLSPSGDRLLFSAGNPQFKMVMITGLQR